MDIYIYIYIYIYIAHFRVMIWEAAPIFYHNHPKTSNNKHDCTPIKYLNILHHYRTQKQLQYFFLLWYIKIYCKNITNFLFWMHWTCLVVSCKKWTPFLTSFLRYCKDLQSCYFECFENASPCLSIMIVLPCR